MFIIIPMIILILFLIKFLINKIECKLIFRPAILNIEEAFQIVENSEYHENLQNHVIKINSKESINLLYFINENSDKLILFSHGNAGHIYNRFNFIERFGEIASIIMFDYRGFGLSKGISTEKSANEDIYEVWNFIINKLKINPSNIILYGESLGCSISLHLVYTLIKLGKYLPGAIICQSGFYNLKELIKENYGYLLTFFIHSKFDNIKYIKKIKNKIPLLIIHSANDEMIHIKHAHKIIKEIGIIEDKLITISGLHNSPNFDKKAQKKIQEFISPQIK